MPRIALGLVTCFAIVAAGCSSKSGTGTPPANTPGVQPPAPVVNKDVKSIVGVWTFPEPKELPKDKGGGKIMVTIEFTADGKHKLTESINGEGKTEEATYTLEGNVLSINPKEGGPPNTLTIKKVTDTELTILDPKKGERDIKFVRKK